MTIRIYIRFTGIAFRPKTGRLSGLTVSCRCETDRESSSLQPLNYFHATDFLRGFGLLLHMLNHKPKGLYILGTGAFELIYGPEELADIAEMVEITAPQQTPQSVQANPALLSDIEVIFSGWGGPRIDPAFLAAAPHLKAFFYGSGATGGMIYPQAFERGVVVVSAAAINGIPVAEFTVAAAILCLKQAFALQRATHERRTIVRDSARIIGAYRSTVALISMGAIGVAVKERLSAVLPDVHTIVYDPFVSPEMAAALGVELVSLEEAFKRGDVVSLHTPWLKETERMIRGAHFASMKPNASFINTARGAVIAEDEMIEALHARPDLTAILDVTHPEPPAEGSQLYSLANVFLTPHVAGSVNGECRRMGRAMVDEARRYLNGEPLMYQILPETSANTSHRPPVAK